MNNNLQSNKINQNTGIPSDTIIKNNNLLKDEEISKLKNRISELEIFVNTRNDIIKILRDELNQSIRESVYKDKIISEKDKNNHDQSEFISQHERQLEYYEQNVAFQTNLMSAKDAALNEKNSLIMSLEGLVDELEKENDQYRLMLKEK